MPRGIYDRSKARRRTSRRTPAKSRAATSSATLSSRIEQLSKELSSLSEEVKRLEGVQNAVNQYMQLQANAAAPQPSAAPTARRRGRPPGSKNRPKADGTTPRRRPGRPRGSRNRPQTEAAMMAAPRRRGRPPKSAASA